MGGPFWLTGTFAAVMLTVAVYCAARLVAARWWRCPTELDTDGAHVVMGVAMSGMLVTGLRSLPATCWEGVFAAGAAWFGWRMLQARRAAPQASWRCLHPAPHLVECAAMLYMLLLLPGRGIARIGMPAAGSGFSFLALPLALFMLGYVAWVGDRLTAPATGCRPAGSARRFLAPRCSSLCKMAMGITMGYMLILMLLVGRAARAAQDVAEFELLIGGDDLRRLRCPRPGQADQARRRRRDREPHHPSEPASPPRPAFPPLRLMA